MPDPAAAPTDPAAPPPEANPVLLRLALLEAAVGADSDEGLRGDVKEVKADIKGLRTDVMTAIGNNSSAFDKLLNADPKVAISIATILATVLIAVVAIVYGATVKYGGVTVGSPPPPVPITATE